MDPTRKLRATAQSIRQTPRRALELIAIITDYNGMLGLHLAATICTAGGMRRETFSCDETPAGLVAAIRDVAGGAGGGVRARTAWGGSAGGRGGVSVVVSRGTN